ncbi:MAG: hypothetical protein KF778_10245 [Rhodocyclaceae bacterium]|nr:hypothetical protein [Rhodocyclaceae bacterium]MBX3668770.1 hypothetical protein [Rhodocyclaceae bacterium]
MRDHPTGEELLACARRVLKDKLLPAIGADQRHDLLMVMNALSIAERQLQYGEAPQQQELNELNQLLGTKALDLTSANRELSRRLRAGLAEPGQAGRAAILAHLRRVGLQRLKESNPKLVKQPPAAGGAV